MTDVWQPADRHEAAALEHTRRICLAFPESVEEITWGHPNFRVRKKIFVFVWGDENGVTLTVKAPVGEQALLLATGDPFFMPAYVGSKGWVGIRVGPDTNWAEVAELIEDSYCEIAPRTLSRRIHVEDDERIGGT